MSNKGNDFATAEIKLNFSLDFVLAGISRRLLTEAFAASDFSLGRATRKERCVEGIFSDPLRKSPRNKWLKSPAVNADPEFKTLSVWSLGTMFVSKVT